MAAATAERQSGAPTLRVERAFGRAGVRHVIGCDEVGRGALAGPVAVGMVVVETARRTFPEGLRDSKLLSEPRREELAPLCAEWVAFSAVGLATAEEVDRLGLTACLGLAGARAMTALMEAGAATEGVPILLDGSFDYLSRSLPRPSRVTSRIKADRDCASVAAASVIAKVHRDRIMIGYDTEIPGYHWTSNKGYGSRAHLAAIAELGPSRQHRVSWLATPSLLPDPAQFA